MWKKKDIKGEVFGRLTAISFDHTHIYKCGTKEDYWLFECSCGKKIIASIHNVMSGNTNSCGCLKKELWLKERTKHGGTLNQREKSLYSIWKAMRRRCNSKKIKEYHRYGGRGISVCKEWDNYTSFRDWSLSNGWKDGLTIDRIDNDGNYCPNNCRWIYLHENIKKTSRVRITDEQAKEIRKRFEEGCSKLAREYGVSYACIWHILHNDCHIEITELNKCQKI